VRTRVGRGRQTKADLERKLAEALAQQAATSEVLQVISRSPGELDPVFHAMLANAVRLCAAKFGILWLAENGGFRSVALYGLPPAFTELRRREPFVAFGPLTGVGRVLKSKQVFHVDDMRDPAFLEHDARAKNLVELGGARTGVFVPLLKGTEGIGVLVIYRQEVRSFTDKQIALLTNFAIQAVIAIENTRLLNELRESLQQQTATSEVLSAISSSPGKLEPVFSTMLENAVRICGARFGNLLLFDGNAMRVVAMHNAPPAFEELRRRNAVIPLEQSILGPLVRTKKLVHVADITTEEPYASSPLAKAGGARTALGVPMLREDELVGVVAIYHQDVRPFTNRQIELLQNFAAQAVIAIENARLLNELRQRTDDITESLEQQTATSEVLKVISGSPGDLDPVFRAVLANATQLCEASYGTLWLTEGDAFCTVASHGDLPRAGVEPWKSGNLYRPGPDVPLGRVAKTRQPVHVSDMREDPSYLRGDKLPLAAVDRGVRTLFVVPMLRESDLVGAIAIYRTEVRPFSSKQIELVKNFAAQAVIAIENTRLLSELRESLERQTATSEVLQVISSSPGELQPVFDAMLANATRLCEASYGNLWLCEGDKFRTGGIHGTPPAFIEQWRPGIVFRPGPNIPAMHALRTRQPYQVADMRESDAYRSGDPLAVAGVDVAGIRTLLAVPMFKDNEPVGVIIIFRTELRPFSDKHVELVTNFSAQAVIAIENARLLNELRESLEQQTATAEVLGIISSSPGELEPVFQAMLKNALRICDARFGHLLLYDGERFQAGALHDAPPAYAEIWQHGPIRAGPKTGLGLMIRTKKVVHVTDLKAEEAYTEGDPLRVATVDLAGPRTYLGVPMLKENNLLGAITIYRQEVKPFTDKQIELLTNFARQAVIAIENTRLLNELRESLQQQTATADVLRIISSSPDELGPVFNTMIENATRLCGAEVGTFALYDGSGFRGAAVYGHSERYADVVTRFHRAPPGTGLGRLEETRQTIQVADVAAEGTYEETRRLNPDFGRVRTALYVPIVKERDLIGAFMIYRHEVRPFTDKQVALVENFAAQAVIAIENARLLAELRESLQQQTATADVLKVISRSTFDLQAVLQTLVESAARLCDADKATITRQKDGVFFRAEAYGFSPEFNEYVRTIPVEPGRGTVLGRALLEGTIVHIPDVQADPEYTFVEAQKLGGFRTMLGVPMLREGIPVGVLALTRSEVRPFTEKQIELVSTFADQAAIAIENVRLFESVEARTRELAKLLDDLRTAQGRLVQTEKLASLGQLTAGIAHEIKNPLNFINNFSAVSVELIDELLEALASVHLDSKLRAEINELADMLQGNLAKVVQHGKRADSIVKNMLLHSRQDSGEHRLVDINALVEESLNLAYHGARAEKQGFNITLERAFDPAAGDVDLFPQEITRVLLNLISNGFYAATKRKTEVNGGDYEPTLSATTRSLGDGVEIRIRDNGTGIPPEVREKMFNPFFTTKPAGEGTGLGLSLSHDIIVKQHGGAIEVDTKPGEFTEFRIFLPRRAASTATSGERI
jgi:GAF domain-containing protein